MYVSAALREKEGKEGGGKKEGERTRRHRPSAHMTSLDSKGGMNVLM